MRKNTRGAVWVTGLCMMVMLLVLGQANVATATPAIMAGTTINSCTVCHSTGIPNSPPAPAPMPDPTPAPMPDPTPAPMPDPAPTSTACTPTINGVLSLHLPFLNYVNPMMETLTLWVDLVYESNPTYPTLILFKFVSAGIINNISVINEYSNMCQASTLSGDLKIHIPDVLLPDGISHIWVDLDFDPDLSTGGNLYFTVTGFGLK